EVVIDRWAILEPGEPFYRDKDNPDRKGPMAFVAVMALSGTTTLSMGKELVSLQPPPQACLAAWDSRSGKTHLQPLHAWPAWLNPKGKAVPKHAKVRQDLDAGFGSNAVDVAIASLLKSTDPLTVRAAVRSLGAIDDLPNLLEMLNSDRAEARSAAVDALY